MIKGDGDQSPGGKSGKKSYFGQKSKISVDFENKNFDELFAGFSDSNEQTLQGDNFVELFKDKLNVHSNQAENTNNVRPTPHQLQAVKQFSSSWLATQCENHIAQQKDSALNVTDLTSAVFEILNSTKTNDEIQTDLFDLLGFDAFDLILKILEHRNDIITAAIQPSYQDDQADYQYIDPTRKQNKPLPGQQVTIQSEHEKNLLKKMAKEERKLMRRDPELYNELFQVNREQEEIIRNTPLFKKAIPGNVQQYPYVFDEFAQRKLSSAYVGGAKILLPESAQKNSYQKYEEVDIPATGSKPPGYLDMFVDIRSLDEV